MVDVKEKENLQLREEVIRDFIGASKDLRDFCENSVEHYRQELLNHELTKETRETCLKNFIESVQRVNPTVVALRDADVQRGKAMLDIIAFLQANWGNWEYKSESGELKFNREKLTDEYNQNRQALDEIIAEMQRLQAKAESLRTQAH